MATTAAGHDAQELPAPSPERCAAHPGRLAVDRCPRCARPRCGPDQLTSGCPLCLGHPGDPDAVRRKPAAPELLVRGVLGAYATAITWAYVTAEYVEASWLAYIAPALLGILCGWAALAAAANPRPGPLLQRVRVGSVVCSVLGIGLGFLLENPYAAPGIRRDEILPYLIGALAAWFWTAPPRSKQAAPRGAAQEGAAQEGAAQEGAAQEGADNRVK